MKVEVRRLVWLMVLVMLVVGCRGNEGVVEETATRPEPTPIEPTEPVPTPTDPPLPTATLDPDELEDLLFDAVKTDDVAEAERLLSAGADVNVRSILDVTPLIVASLRGHAPMITLLLEHRADLSEMNEGGYTPFVLAVRSGNLEAVQVYLDAGVDIDGKTESEFHATALMEAAKEGHVAVGELLVANGATLDLGDRYGDPALSWAAFYDQPEFVRMLLSAGADYAVVSVNGDTALGFAISQNNPEVEAILREAGATE